MPDTHTERARPRRRRPAGGGEPVAIEVATPAAEEPSELEAAVLAAASGYRFGEIEVPATIARAIESMGFVTPTEVQARAIPPLRRGEDLIGQAQTGTGKTAAFGIPIVEKIEPSSSHVQALILTPTRELCVQVEDEIARIGRFRGVRTVAIYGGSSMDRQVEALKRGAQVVVGTPGRVLDLIRRRELLLDRVQHRHPRRGRPHARHGLHRRRRDDPQPLAAKPPDGAVQRDDAVRDPPHLRPVHEAEPGARHRAARPAHGRDGPPARVLRRRAGQGRRPRRAERALRLRPAPRLPPHPDRRGPTGRTLKRRGKNVAALHGGLSQRERDRTLAAFRAGKIQFLIATNVASRGLDITDLPYVLSFDIPEDADTYVHRIGRTGRAGREGTAITFVGEWDLDAWEAIRAEVGARVEVGELDLYGAAG